jgi:dienelactone hydrolase
MNDFFAAIEFMQHYSGTTGKVGITGFCYGGGVSNAAAVAFLNWPVRCLLWASGSCIRCP